MLSLVTVSDRNDTLLYQLQGPLGVRLNARKTGKLPLQD